MEENTDDSVHVTSNWRSLPKVDAVEERVVDIAVLVAFYETEISMLRDELEALRARVAEAEQRGVKYRVLRLVRRLLGRT